MVQRFAVRFELPLGATMSNDQLFDDRLFLTSVYAGQVEKTEDGYIVTKIQYDQVPPGAIWIVNYYRNVPQFPIVGTYHFQHKEDALKYLSIVEPTTPLQSLGGRSPSIPISFPDYVKWKTSKGFLDFHPDRAFSSGGENRGETIFQTQEQFDAGLRKTHQTLQNKI